MILFNKFRTFFKLDGQMQVMLIEAFCYLAWGRYLKMLNFSRVAPTLGKSMSETSCSTKTSDKQTLQNVSAAIHLMSRYTFWESECLVKAIAGMKMLEKRRIESTLYLGTAKEKTGNLVAHAWLRSGPYYISGSETMNKFTVVASFAKENRNKKAEGE